MEMEAVIAILYRCRLDWELVTSDVISYEIFLDTRSKTIDTCAGHHRTRTG